MVVVSPLEPHSEASLCDLPRLSRRPARRYLRESNSHGLIRNNPMILAFGSGLHLVGKVIEDVMKAGERVCIGHAQNYKSGSVAGRVTRLIYLSRNDRYR